MHKTEEINRLLKAVTVQWQLLEYSICNEQGVLAGLVELTTREDPGGDGTGTGTSLYEGITG